MAQYNWFGCTITDITNAFKGAVSADFGGDAVIQAEMDMAEAELLMVISPKVIQMFDQIEYMELPQVPGISGSYSYTAVPPILQDLYVYQVPRYNPALNNSVTMSLGLSCSTSNCSNFKKELDSSYLFNDYTLVGSTITFGASFNQDTNTYYLSYAVDKNSLILNSLKGLIRDRVACVLGMQLYSKGDDTWSLVDLYCSRAERLLGEEIFPAEFKKFKWLNSPFKSGITSIKLGRA